jgi:hypothetical protein
MPSPHGPTVPDGKRGSISDSARMDVHDVIKDLKTAGKESSEVQARVLHFLAYVLQQEPTDGNNTIELFGYSFSNYQKTWLWPQGQAVFQWEQLLDALRQVHSNPDRTSASMPCDACNH